MAPPSSGDRPVSQTGSARQRALGVPEILTIILSHANSASQQRATWVNRYWRQVAVKIYWRIVSGTKALAFVGALKELTSKHNVFVEPPGQQDCAAHEIIRGAVHVIDDLELSAGIASDISMSPFISKPMCPHLKKFTWKMPRNPDAFQTHALHSLFLHAGVTEVSIRGLHPACAVGNLHYPLRLFGRDMGSLACNLTSLTITSNCVPSQDLMPGLQEHLVKVLEGVGLERLRQLTLSPCFLTKAIYETLGRAESLESLAWPMTSANEQCRDQFGDVSTALTLHSSVQLRPGSFISLATVALCMPLPNVTKLFSTDGFPVAQLTAIYIRATGVPKNPDAELSVFLQVFGQHCQKAKVLFIALDRGNITAQDAAKSVTLQSLVHLRAATWLETLTISDGNLVHLLEEQLLHVIEPLPHLSTFWLTPTPSWRRDGSAPQPMYNMQTVGRIVGSHRHLKSLGLYLDLASDVDVPNESPQHRLDELFIGNSPCPHPTSPNSLNRYLNGKGELPKISVGSDPWTRLGFRKEPIGRSRKREEDLTEAWLQVLPTSNATPRARSVILYGL
ncbi:unnamed protein product [Peniophora sp. CBMAI 1063]|nr:unnamed protein product [Peniophora sp. CBMAI 1063]